MSSTPGLVARRSCPVCGTAAGSPILSLAFDTDPLARYLHDFYLGRLDGATLAPDHYELADCAGCGLVFQTNVPNDELLEDLYARATVESPATLAARRGLDVRVGYANDVEQALRYMSLPPEQVRVLDFGSGSGDWLRMAAAFGCDTTGSELHAGAIQATSEAGHAAIALDDLPSEHFDFINCEQVVEHLVNPARVLARLVLSLRAGGLIRVSVPNGSDIRERLTIGDWTAAKGSPRSLNAVAPLEHLNCFDHGSLQLLGTNAGLAPFRYPVRMQLHPMGRLRLIGGSIAGRLHPRPGTVQLFQKS